MGSQAVPSNLFCLPLLLLLHIVVLIHQWQPANGFVGIFEAWNRKNYKSKDIRYAMFDPDGLITFDGNVNGKSNDLQFPNGVAEKSNTCDKNPELIFELCETDSHKAWTLMALCYESQLQQTEINPFYRVASHASQSKLVDLMCGNHKQAAIFINRTVSAFQPELFGMNETERRDWDTREEMNKNKTLAHNNNKTSVYYLSRKYKPYYSIWTSFAPEKIHFQMPPKPEKQCALLILGGSRILSVAITDLRRMPLKLYKDEFVVKGKYDRRNESAAIWNTSDTNDFLHQFPDMANRKNRLSDNPKFEFLMLDFLPNFGKVQNISIFGWLPLKVKITSKAINPCRVDWRLLESREVKGRIGALTIIYLVQTGTTFSKSQTTGGSTANSKSKSESKDTSLGGSISLPVASVSAEASWSNTFGSQQMSNTDFNVASELSKSESKERTEQIEFENLQDQQVNVEQMVYVCHGISIFPDKIRYHDKNGRDIKPVGQQTDDGEGEQMAPQPDYCMDAQEECKIWAAQGQCKQQAAAMLVQCKASCNLCPKVEVKQKGSTEEDMIAAAAAANDDDDDCEDKVRFCPAWKRQDECQKTPSYMSVQCRKSCGLCIDYDDIDPAQRELEQKRKI